MGIDYSKRGGSSAPASPPATGAPISLTKRGEKVDLAKGGSSGQLRINLNWNQAAPVAKGAGGFMKKLTGQTGAIDLDLGCLFELSDGTKGAVQALGNSFGTLDAPPFVKLDKDDRSGTASDGENLLINGTQAATIKRLAVFAFIYEGAKSWSQADGKVTIHPAAGAPITIDLDETRDGVGMCAVCIVHGSSSGFTIERQVQYVSGHQELDKMFGWGMQWRAGSK